MESFIQKKTIWMLSRSGSMSELEIWDWKDGFIEEDEDYDLCSSYDENFFVQLVQPCGEMLWPIVSREMH